MKVVISLIFLLCLIGSVVAACSSSCEPGRFTCNSNDVCVCNPGYAGKYCKQTRINLTAGNPVTVTGTDTATTAVLAYQGTAADTTAFKAIRFKFSKISGDCSDMDLRFNYDCHTGEATSTCPSYPSTDTSPDKRWSGSLENGMVYYQNFRTKGDSSRACSCSNTVTGTWFAQPVVRSGSGCVVSVMAKTVDPCNGHGTYTSTSDSCVCADGYAGEYCSYVLQPLQANTNQQTVVLTNVNDTIPDDYPGKMFVFDATNPAIQNWGTMVFNASRVSGDCDGIYFNSRYNCGSGSCATSWPSRTSNAANGGYSSRYLNDKPFALKYTSKSNCFCQDKPTVSGKFYLFVGPGSFFTSKCVLNIGTFIQDACSYHGTYDSNNQECTCYDGFGGDQCEYPVQKLYLNTAVQTTVALGWGNMFIFDATNHQNYGQLRINATVGNAVQPIGQSYCKQIQVSANMDCGGCPGKWPSESTPPNKLWSTRYWDFTSANSLSNSYQGSAGSSCGCGGNPTIPIQGKIRFWIKNGITDSQYPPCTFSLQIGILDKCNFHGTYDPSNGKCTCHVGYAGSTCEYPMPTRSPGIQTVTTTSNIPTMFRYDLSQLNKAGTIRINITKVSGTCTSQTLKMTRVCSGCMTSNWPTSSASSIFSSTSYSLDTLPGHNKQYVLNSYSSTKCGCASGAPLLSMVYRVGIYGSSNSPDCTFTLDFQALDKCNNRGTYDASNDVCTCSSASYGGRYCQFTLKELTINTMRTVTLHKSSLHNDPGQIMYFYDATSVNNWGQLVMNATKVSGACSNMVWATTFNCQDPGCDLKWPEAGTNYVPSGSSSSITTNMGSTQIRTVTNSIHNAKCNCDKKPTVSGKFYTMLGQASDLATCTFNFGIYLDDQCSYHGSYQNGECLCNPGFGGDRCQLITTPIVDAQTITFDLAKQEQRLFTFDASPFNNFGSLKMNFTVGQAVQDSAVSYCKNLKTALTYRCGNTECRADNWPTQSGQPSYVGPVSIDLTSPSTRVVDNIYAGDHDKCGCISTDPRISGNYRILVENDQDAGSSFPGCKGLTMGLYVLDRCSNHGSYSPQTSKCTCANGWSGETCDLPVTNLAANKLVSWKSTPNAKIMYFMDANPVENYGFLELSLTQVTGKCNNLAIYMTSVCAGCNDDNWPSSTVSDLPSSASSIDASVQKWTYEYGHGSSRTKCGCSGKPRISGTYRIMIENKGTLDCDVEFSNKVIDFCNHRGGYVTSTGGCNCNSGYGGQRCEFPITALSTGVVTSMTLPQIPTTGGDPNLPFTLYRYQYPTNKKNPQGLSFNFTTKSVNGVGSCFSSSNTGGAGSWVSFATNSDCGTCATSWCKYPSMTKNCGTASKYDTIELNAQKPNFIQKYAYNLDRPAGCGCDERDDLSGTWYMAIEKQAGTPPCHLTIMPELSDACNGKGSFASNTSYCSCDAGYAGETCLWPMQSMSRAAATASMVLNSGDRKFFKFPLPSGVWDVKFSLQKKSKTGSCSRVDMQTSYGCMDNGVAGCSAPYPHVDEDKYTAGTATFPQEKTIKFDDPRSECGCGKSSSSDETWYVYVANNNVQNGGINDRCQMDLVVTLTPNCPKGCDTNGTCDPLTGRCKCKTGFVGLNCGVPVPPIAQIFNLNDATASIMGGEQHRYFLNTSSTNTEMNITLRFSPDSTGEYVEDAVFRMMMKKDGSPVVDKVVSTVFDAKHNALLRTQFKCTNCDYQREVSKSKKVALLALTQKDIGDSNWEITVAADATYRFDNPNAEFKFELSQTMDDGFGTFFDVVCIIGILIAASYLLFKIRKNPRQVFGFLWVLRSRIMGENMDKLEDEEARDFDHVSSIKMIPDDKVMVHVYDLLSMFSSALRKVETKLPGFEVAATVSIHPYPLLCSLHNWLAPIPDLPMVEIEKINLPPVPIVQVLTQIMSALEDVEDLANVELVGGELRLMDAITEVAQAVAVVSTKIAPISLPVIGTDSFLSQMVEIVEDIPEVPYLEVMVPNEGQSDVGYEMDENGMMKQSLLGETRAVQANVLFTELANAVVKLPDDIKPTLILPGVTNEVRPVGLEALLVLMEDMTQTMPILEEVKTRSIAATQHPNTITLKVLIDSILAVFEHSIELPGVFIRDSLLIVKSEKQLERERKEEEAEDGVKANAKAVVADVQEGQGMAEDAGLVANAGGVSGVVGGGSAVASTLAVTSIEIAERDGKEMDKRSSRIMTGMSNLRKKTNLATVDPRKLYGLLAGLHILIMLFRLMMSLFNVGLIHGAFSKVASVPAIEKLEGSVKSVLGGFGPFASAMATMFGKLNVLPLLFRWNCKGAFLFLSCIGLLFGTRLFIRAIENDWLLRWSIRLSNLKQREESAYKAKLLDKVVAFVETAIFALMQMFVMFLFNMLSSAWAPDQSFQQSCSATDHFFLSFSFALMVIGLLFALVSNFFVFVGRPSMEKIKREGLVGLGKEIALGWYRIFLLSVGVWNENMMKSYRVVQRGNTLVDFDTSEGTRHEAIVQVTGRTNGMMFLLLPGMAFFSQTAAALNESILFNLTPRLKLSESNVNIRTYHWVNALVVAVCQLLVALVASQAMVVLLVIVLLPGFAYNLYQDVKKTRDAVAQAVREQKNMEMSEKPIA